MVLVGQPVPPAPSLPPRFIEQGEDGVGAGMSSVSQASFAPSPVDDDTDELLAELETFEEDAEGELEDEDEDGDEDEGLDELDLGTPMGAVSAI